MINLALIARLMLFQASVAAAAPVERATALTKAALVKAGLQLVTAIDTNLAGAGAPLDADDPAGFAGDMIGSLLALSTTADDQATLADLRGRVGRSVFNLAQA